MAWMAEWYEEDAPKLLSGQRLSLSLSGRIIEEQERLFYKFHIAPFAEYSC